MSNRTLLILLAIAAVLGAVWGIKELTSRRQGGAEALSMDALKGIDPALVSQIEVRKGEEAIVLARDGEAWMAGEEDADAEKITSALEAAGSASFTGPVARSPANHDALGVGDHAMVVAVTQGDALFSFRIGNGGPTFDSSYVRMEGEDEVFLADVNFGFQFSVSPASWEMPEQAGGEEQAEEYE